MIPIRLKDLEELQREIPIELSRRNILEFCKYVRPGFQVARHHQIIGSYLQRWVNGDITRLMLFAPPRHGKSEIVSRCLPAYLFGRFPNDEIISMSHTASLAVELSTDMQGVMDSERYQQVFPGVRLKRRGVKCDPTDARTQNRFKIVNHRGKFFAGGVGGPIVGRGFTWGIIDDPIKGREHARSSVQRNKTNRWYTTQFATRMQPDARILLMHQRWHINDLAGMLLRQAMENPTADQWEVVSFPAIAETPLPGDWRQSGEPLWPERFPLEFLLARKAENTEEDWLAIYQQRPVAEGGNHFKTHWFDDVYWVERGDRIAIHHRDGRWQEWHLADCMRFGTCDPAATVKPNSDDTAKGAFLQTPDGDLVVLNIDRAKIPIEQIPRSLQEYSIRYGLAWMGIEANGFQVTLAIEARKLGFAPIREMSHRGKGKLTRATPAMIHASNGKIILPQDVPWKRGFLERLASFTGHEGEEDDETDVLSYAVLEMTVRSTQASNPTPKDKDREPIGLPPINEPERRLFG